MAQLVENPLLDPANLARIDDLSLLARVVVEGNHFGLHRSRKQGHGSEFFQYRNYEPGEDLKNIDWKVFAKQNELVAKTYEETSNANLILILDASASMSFQGNSSPCSKFRYSQMLAACLAYLAYRQGDRIGLFGGNQENLQWLFPESGKESFKSILTKIGSLIPQGKDPDDQAWEKFKASLPAQATVVIISDFLEDEDRITDRLSFAHSSRYECLCLQVIDPIEENLPEMDAVRFASLEGDEEKSASPERIRQEYQRRFLEHLNTLTNCFAACGAEYTVLKTVDNLGLGIRKFIGLRSLFK